MKEHDFDTELVSIVAHDLKTPVSAAKGFIELVQQTGPLNERQRHFSDKAMAAMERMERLISDLLDYARLEGGLAPKSGECDVIALIEDARAMMQDGAERRGIQIMVESSARPMLIRADERLISQVIANLMSNAIKYNRDGGTISIRVRPVQEMVRVEIQDTGMGIAPDELDRVFDRFYRTRLSAESTIDGTGLGLTITRSIILGHGGRIWVESVVGEGSTFSFTLPAVVKRSGRRSKPITEPVENETASEENDVVSDELQSPPEFADSETPADHTP